MSLAPLVVASVAVVNPARLRPALPTSEARLVGALGAAVSWLALVPAATFAEPLLHAIDVEPSTLRMAAGVVLALQGATVVVSRPPRPEPALRGRAAAIVPVAFPLTLTPGVALLALSGAVDRSAPVTLGVLAGTLATVPLLAAAVPWPGSPVAQRVVRGVGRVTGAVLVLGGLGLLFNGILDI